MKKLFVLILLGLFAISFVTAVSGEYTAFRPITYYGNVPQQCFYANTWSIIDGEASWCGSNNYGASGSSIYIDDMLYSNIVNASITFTPRAYNLSWDGELNSTVTDAGDTYTFNYSLTNSSEIFKLYGYATFTGNTQYRIDVYDYTEEDWDLVKECSGICSGDSANRWFDYDSDYVNGGIVTVKYSGLSEDINLTYLNWTHFTADVLDCENISTWWDNNVSRMYNSTQNIFNTTETLSFDTLFDISDLLYKNSAYDLIFGLDADAGNCYLEMTDLSIHYIYYGYNQYTFSFNSSKDGSTLSPTCSVVEGEIDTNYIYGDTSGETTDTITCTLNGYDTLIESFTIADGDQNFEMTPTQLDVGFYYYNGTSANVTGWWSDTNITQNFTDVNLTIFNLDIINDYIRVHFAWNDSVMNYTQFYEYDNSVYTGNAENLTKLDNPDTSIWFKVIDMSGNVIDKALIRTSFSYPSIGGEYVEMGQRYTGLSTSIGYSWFNFDSNSDVWVRVTKDGYSLNEFALPVDEIGTKSFSDPYIITLEKSENTVSNGAIYIANNLVENDSTTFNIKAYNPSVTSITYTTDYRVSEGKANLTLSLNSAKNGLITLTNGTDYCNGCDDDDILYVYLWAGNNSWTLEIPYVDIYVSNDAPSGLHTQTFFRLVWILLLLLVGILGLVLKGSEESVGDGENSKIFLFIGIFIINLVFALISLKLMVIVLLWAILMGLRKYYAE